MYQKAFAPSQGIPASMSVSRPDSSWRQEIAWPGPSDAVNAGPKLHGELVLQVDVPALAAGLLDQPHRLDAHAPVDRLAHIVDG